MKRIIKFINSVITYKVLGIKSPSCHCLGINLRNKSQKIVLNMLMAAKGARIH